MNDADRAQRSLEHFSQLNIAQLRQQPAPKANGLCLYCQTRVANGVLFCDSDCRDDFERLARRKARA